MIGFNHSMLHLVVSTALGPRFFRENISAWGLIVMNSESSLWGYINSMPPLKLIRYKSVVVNTTAINPPRKLAMMFCN